MIMTRSQMMGMMSNPKIREYKTNMDPQPNTSEDPSRMLLDPDHKKLENVYIDNKGRMRHTTIKR